MKYTVHLYPQVHVRIPDIEAESQVEAIQKAEESTDFHRLLDRGEIEYAEEITTAHVDEEGDRDYERSSWYDWKDGKWVTP